MKSLNTVKDVAKNLELVAGTGDQCLPYDETRCGDGGKAVEATLTNPRGESPDVCILHVFINRQIFLYWSLLLRFGWGFFKLLFALTDL